MAGKKRSPKRRDRLARWQGPARLGAAVFVAGVVGALAFLYVSAAIPPQDLPWTPLRLADPVGMATRAKLVQSRERACRHVLLEGAVVFQDAPRAVSGFCKVEDALRLASQSADLRPAAPLMTCRAALAYKIWERQVVQPAAIRTFGVRVASVEHLGTYACRRRYGRADTGVSEHAYANAVDIAGFVLADGRRISVQRDWTRPGLEGLYLRRVRDGACRLYGAVLSPDYNRAHFNHLHLDMGPWISCR